MEVVLVMILHLERQSVITVTQVTKLQEAVIEPAQPQEHGRENNPFVQVSIAFNKYLILVKYMETLIIMHIIIIWIHDQESVTYNLYGVTTKDV